MIFLTLILIGVVVLGLAAGSLVNHSEKKKNALAESEEAPAVRPIDSECCGQHQICEKESLLAAVSKQVEYYDDEELDRFKNHPADTYTPAEVEEFRDILYTMHEDEVAGWTRSLQLRGVTLPSALRDEVLLIIEERRSASQQKPQTK